MSLLSFNAFSIQLICIDRTPSMSQHFIENVFIVSPAIPITDVPIKNWRDKETSFIYHLIAMN